jgi:hypothetical protein
LHTLHNGQVRADLCGEEGGLLVMDVTGGATLEKGGLLLERVNPVTGAKFQWEQAGYNPVTRWVCRGYKLCLHVGFKHVLGWRGRGRGGGGGGVEESATVAQCCLWPGDDALQHSTAQHSTAQHGA